MLLNDQSRLMAFHIYKDVSDYSFYHRCQFVIFRAFIRPKQASALYSKQPIMKYIVHLISHMICKNQ